ncbi:MAG: nuclear transport factor 2 family protein [Flavobacteriales bacterium]
MNKLFLLFPLFLLISCVVNEATESNHFDENEVDSLMNKWHHSATVADSSFFFDFMSENAIYLGTAPKERWTKKQFADFAMPYFRKGKAWDFKTNWRNWYYSQDGQTIWFEESLSTWMEECRGSGVLIRQGSDWKLVHYNLTVLIENEKIKEFIELRKL